MSIISRGFNSNSIISRGFGAQIYSTIIVKFTNAIHFMQSSAKVNFLNKLNRVKMK